MAVFIGNGLNNTANAPGGTLTPGFVGGNLAQLQDAFGDVIVGLGGNDVVVAGNGNDIINGGDGNDFIDGRFGLDVMDGGNGTDTMDVSFFAGSYVWDMSTGITNFSAAGEFAFNFENARTGAGADRITGNVANNDISLGAGNDSASGGFGNDNLFGSSGNDSLFGDAGRDSLNGGLGNDLLVGGLGRDVMTGGGGFERFDFNSVGESLPGFFSRDVITDFDGNGFFAGDVIDVSTIDANVFLFGNQAFNFIGGAAFTAPGQLRYSGGVLQGSTDFDVFSEFEIQLTGAPSVSFFDLRL